MIKQNQRVLNVVMVLTDALVVTIALFCAWWLRFKTTLFGPIGGHLGLQSYVIFNICRNTDILNIVLFFWSL